MEFLYSWCTHLSNFDIRDIYFIGGFGTVAWVDVKEYEDLKADKIALEGGEHCLKVTDSIPFYDNLHFLAVKSNN